MQPGATEFVYRALTKEKSATDKSFRLREGEPTLSIARTPEKAMGTLSCKGWAKLSVHSIEAIPGLSVRVKVEGQEDPENPDADLLEIVGLPLHGDSEQDIQDYAMALAKTVVESRTVPKKRRDVDL